MNYDEKANKSENHYPDAEKGAEAPATEEVAASTEEGTETPATEESTVKVGAGSETVPGAFPGAGAG